LTTGGGKNQTKSSGYCFKTFESLKYFSNQVSNFLTPRREEELFRGAVLIEFAVCMPVLIILLFYVHDLMKIKRLYSQTEFVGQQMANILQNIAKTRTITINDIKYSAALSYLSIYPGNTMFTIKSGREWHLFAHQPRVYIYYVKGGADQKASTVWGLWIRSGTAVEPKKWHSETTQDVDFPGSIVSLKKNVAPSSIYSLLKMEGNYSKIILEAQMRWNSSEQLDANGKLVKSARKVFGCYLVNPKDNAKAAYFSSIVVFSPNRGFTENVPT